VGGEEGEEGEGGGEEEELSDTSAVEVRLSN
jgi:hypothetical protein